MWGRSDRRHFQTCSCQATLIGSNLLLRICYAKARTRGINPDRARTGFLELEKFVAAARKGTRPVDGYYVELGASC